MPPSNKPRLEPLDTSHGTEQPPFDTAELRRQLRRFLSTPIEDPLTGKSTRVGSYKFGVYAFYDYDGEPIYVGQTSERLSSRVSRHLTNQRTDAVAMNVLDPFEVHDIEVWPLPQFQGRRGDDPEGCRYLDALEAAVFSKLLQASRFNAVLNEKAPTSTTRVRIPESVRAPIVSPEVRTIRGHPDTRISRRAATLARLAQVISERKVAPGLRRTLLTQAKRLQWLAEQRYAHFAGKDESDEEDESEEQDSPLAPRPSPLPPAQRNNAGGSLLGHGTRVARAQAHPPPRLPPNPQYGLHCRHTRRRAPPHLQAHLRPRMFLAWSPL